MGATYNEAVGRFLLGVGDFRRSRLVARAAGGRVDKLLLHDTDPEQHNRK
jgi:hypothetical protein